ncbi:hypothetical protein [uncultured Paenibacillus sp.]|uniref:hypothetical protein n=1 Tax=uncultured Paenibacillus sp. TaxID=227322 RepID=UPI0028D218B6|nr:hypothetical protein [uncultured Paenibacillus sp.]
MAAAEVTERDFVYRLVSDKKEYVEGEPVLIYAELEYVGDKDSVTIYHASSPFYFPIVEKTRDYVIGYAMDQPLISTTLERGKPLREDYRKSGGYTEQDNKEYIAFMKAFSEGNGFPAGRYEVDGFADFFVESAENGQENYKIKAQMEFAVR